MGRRSIGETAMSGAMRTRLYRQRRAAAKPVTESVPESNAQAARIAELEQQQQLAASVSVDTLVKLLRARPDQMASWLHQQLGRETTVTLIGALAAAVAADETDRDPGREP
jgi:hypothetical protein